MDMTAELLGAWIDSARDYAILLVDPQGRVSSWNVGAERILGYAEDEALGQPISIFFTPEDRERGVPKREMERAASNGRASDDRWHIRKDGSRFWCSGVLMRIGSEPGAPDGYVKVMRDLTERKLLEERLRARTEELLAADRRRNEFLAMLSHELRNPLAPILTSAYLLRSMLANADPIVREARDMIERQAIRLKGLMDGLTDVVRMTLQRIEIERKPVALAEVVGRAIASVRPAIDRRGLDLIEAIDPGPIVLSADPLRIEQTISALLSNAVRFTEPGGRITITAGRDADLAVVRVHDTGIGMTPELAGRIFEMFEQGEQGLARSEGGLGIGLTLARTVAQLHGGTLTAQSEGPGRGSEFVLRLPIDNSPLETPESTPGHSTPEREDTRRLRILLVDDNHDAARSAELVLQQAGYQVVLAHDGAKAVELALSLRPDVAILDVGLPILDGYAVARELRQRTRIPLVALSGYLPETTTGLLFDAYLVKPVEPDELVRVLRSLRTGQSRGSLR